MRGLLTDCRHALRLYVRTPGSSLIAVAALSIGLACVVAFVSLYIGLGHRAHPGFEDGGRIVSFGWRSNGNVSSSLLASLIHRIAEESTTLEAAAGSAVQGLRVGPDGELASGEFVTREFFSGLRPRLALGRGFEADEHHVDGDLVVVISHRYWQQVLGGREDVLGTTLEVRHPDSIRGFTEPEGQGERWADFRVVGVMAPAFTGISGLRSRDGTTLWLPFEQRARLFPPAWMSDSVRLTGIGLRSRGVGNAAVASDLNGRGYDRDLEGLATRLSGAPEESERPALSLGVFDGVVPNPAIQRETRRQLQLLLGASVLLALVTAANVSLFLLARAPGRRRELAVRMSVGAPQRRLARQLATEAGLLVAVATGLGLVLSIWLAGYLRGLEFLRSAHWSDVTLLDWRVLAITALIVTILVLLVALAPILGLNRLGTHAGSRQASARAGVAQRIAGNAQITIASMLGGAAVAFALYLGPLTFGYPGYETRDLHVVTFSFDHMGYFESGQSSFESERFFVEHGRRRDTIQSLPGVTGVSIASAVPGRRRGVYTAYMRDPNSLDDPTAMAGLAMVAIDEHYVDLLGLTLLYGRAPHANEPTALLVNQSFARMMWGREDVVGEHLPIRTFAAPSSEVVGVLADLPYDHPAAGARPLGFATLGQQYQAINTALVRSADSSATLRLLLQGLVDSGALELTIDDVTPLATLRRNALAADTARGLLTISAALLVVLLATFGFYGTQRYLVAAGRREMAIRASLGAGPAAIGRLVIWRGLLLGLPGLVFGGLLAFIVAAWLRDDYVSHAVSPALVTISVVAGFAMLLFAASLSPARTARRTQPATLLREE